MKKLLFAGIVTVAALNTYAQGTVNFANVGAGLTGVRVRNAATGMNAGTQGAGPGIGDFWVQLYYANGTGVAETLLIAGPGNPIHLSAPGIFTGGERELSLIVPSGGMGTFQVRAWSSVLGDSYEGALVAWTTSGPDNSRLLGKSNVFNVDTADPTVIPRPTPANLVGLLSFAVEPVPEPATIALGVLGGLGALVFLRRRK